MTKHQSDLLGQVPGIRHAFGDRSRPIREEIFPDWAEKRPDWKQVHGTQVARISAPRFAAGEADALWTAEPSLPVAVVTADCVPVLLAKKDGSAVAAVHAGWRGTRARILDALWAQLRQAGHWPSDWVAAIGPSIGPCCYEVSEELADEFAREFGTLGEALAVPRHRHLDLPALNAAQLQAIGISQVEIVRACTRCTLNDSGEPAFHSYRREGGGTRQYSMISPAPKA